MNYILENFYCWFRNKKCEEPKKECIENTNIKIDYDLTCGGCFKYIDSMNEFTQITKIGKNYFGVCCDECYQNWLRSPAAQTLAPIKNYEVYVATMKRNTIK